MFTLDSFKDLVTSLDIQNLQICQQLISKAIVSKVSHGHNVPGGSADLSNSSTSPVFNPIASARKDINTLVDYHENFIDKTDHDLLCAEVESLGFNLKSCSDAVQNKFISSFSEPYVWKSKSGDVVNTPLDLAKFPVAKRIMDKINEQFGCTMNSVLATCYVRGAVNCRLHDDAETTLEPSQPICVLSLGVKRKVEFVAKGNKYMHKADLALEPEDSSLYLMKPGCQEYFKHRVRADRRINEHRISLSFRCFIPPDNVDLSPTGKGIANLSLKPEPLATSLPPASTPVADNPVQGFSPFPGQQTFSFDQSHQHQLQDDRVCLMFGSSITKGVHGDKMSRGSRVVINLSESGARISDLHNIASDFFADNQSIINKVDRILINIGTNDIKWLNGRKYSVNKKFRAPLCNLVRDLKYMFPVATIVFISVLPIRAFYNYTARTVNAFYRLLFEVSRDLGCIFFDCFYDFLAPDLQDYNSNLFRDKWHLNDFGLRLLCRALKYVVYGNLFSSVARTSWHWPFYTNFV